MREVYDAIPAYRYRGLGFSVNWEKVPGDEEIAKNVITYLEDRRLLFGRRHLGDQLHCVQSANDIRHFLTGQLSQAKAGKSLEQSLRAMRAAAREFAEAAGPNARNFSCDEGALSHEFGRALGRLQSLVGQNVAVIADKYGIEVEPELGQILPPRIDDDPSFVPGFEDQG